MRLFKYVHVARKYPFSLGIKEISALEITPDSVFLRRKNKIFIEA
jgi:hypothetical protein